MVALVALRPPPRRAPKDEAAEVLALDWAAEFEPAACAFVAGADAAELPEVGAAGPAGDGLDDWLVACAPLVAEELAAGAELEALELLEPGVVAPLGVAATSSGMGGTTGGA
jgi:hypothetical protein